MKQNSINKNQYNFIHEKNKVIKKGFPGSPQNHSESLDIVIWSDVFLHENEESGEKYGILLNITKNVGDSRGFRIFRFLLIITSILIVILDGKIHEKHPYDLQLNALVNIILMV